jgi:hypothetical protein
MRCFYHQDKEAVGLCKSCAKGVCAECAVDLGNALACRNRCEERAQSVVKIQDHAIQSLKPLQPRVQLTASAARPLQPSPPSKDSVAAQLDKLGRSARWFRWSSGAFYVLVGTILILSGHDTPQIILGACFGGFGIFHLVRTQRRSRSPRIEIR